jgi:hypothetical protein
MSAVARHAQALPFAIFCVARGIPVSTLHEDFRWEEPVCACRAHITYI